MIRLVLFGMMGLKVWMLVDAIRRRADPYWLWIIVGIPGGSLIYFFMVRFRDHDAQAIKRQVLSSFEQPPSMEKLKRDLTSSPSILNRMNYAKALTDEGRYEEAKREFKLVVSKRSDDFEALFGLAICEIETGAHAEAIDRLEHIRNEQPGFRDFAVYPELAEAYRRNDQDEKALNLLRGLVKSSPRTQHAVLLARFLQDARKMKESREVLNEALDRYEDSPKYYRKRNREWAKELRRLMKVAVLDP